MNLNSVFIKLVMDHLNKNKINNARGRFIRIELENFIRRSETMGYLTDIVPTKILDLYWELNNMIKN